MGKTKDRLPPMPIDMVTFAKRLIKFGDSLGFHVDLSYVKGLGLEFDDPVECRVVGKGKVRVPIVTFTKPLSRDGPAGFGIRLVLADADDIGVTHGDWVEVTIRKGVVPKPEVK